MSEDGNIEYVHYEKPVATKLVIPARSAHSTISKRSVHVSEVVRRCVNTSRRLSWPEYFVPTLEDYMVRMKRAGYHENYRKDILEHGINIYECKLNENDAGGTPLNRPNGYRKVERRKEKKRKKKDWNKTGNYVAPIIVPATPNSELAKMLKEVTECETDRNLRFKIVEKGGTTIERSLMKSNPTGDDDCGKEDCPSDGSGGGGGMCRKNNVCYKYECRKCNAVYYGETNRNLYSRGKEHQKLYRDGSEKSFMKNHQVEAHSSEPPDFQIQVVKSCKEPLTRQVTEAILIKNHKGELLNSKSEFYQPPIVQVRREVVRGLQCGPG